jgi:predicted tellurium resistance membrane protein TerC
MDRTNRRRDNLLQLAGDPGAWAALAAPSAMEVVLGLDNLVFIAP